MPGKVAEDRSFEDILKQDGWLVYKTRGISMQPMLREDRDVVLIEKPKGRLKKYDVALYRRGAAYVLHRVIGVHEGGYDIRGDNTVLLESVPEEAVIGVLTSFIREGKKYEVTDISYQWYARIWSDAFPVRMLFWRLRYRAKVLADRLGILPLIKKSRGADEDREKGRRRQ